MYSLKKKNSKAKQQVDVQLERGRLSGRRAARHRALTALHKNRARFACDCTNAFCTHKLVALHIDFLDLRAERHTRFKLNFATEKVLSEIYTSVSTYHFCTYLF